MRGRARPTQIAQESLWAQRVEEKRRKCRCLVPLRDGTCRAPPAPSWLPAPAHPTEDQTGTGRMSCSDLRCFPQGKLSSLCEQKFRDLLPNLPPSPANPSVFWDRLGGVLSPLWCQSCACRAAEQRSCTRTCWILVHPGCGTPSGGKFVRGINPSRAGFPSSRGLEPEECLGQPGWSRD